MIVLQPNSGHRRGGLQKGDEAIGSKMGERIVLVGAGHAHLHLIGQAENLRRAGIDLLLISPPKFLYSGLATGALSGALDLDAGAIDVVRARGRAWRPPPRRSGLVRRSCRWSGQAGGRHAHLLRRDLAQRQQPDRRSRPAFDAAWRLGREALGGSPGAQETSRNRDDPDRMPGHCRRRRRRTAHELAAALCELCVSGTASCRTLWLHGRKRPGLGATMGREAATAHLGRRGVALRTDRVTGRSATACELASGERLDCDALVVATGLIGAELTGCLGLPVNREGRLRTSHTLQAIGDNRVFAVGDCAVIDGDARPAVGVFRIRAAPYLLNNLVAFAQGARRSRRTARNADGCRSWTSETERDWPCGAGQAGLAPLRCAGSAGWTLGSCVGREPPPPSPKCLSTDTSHRVGFENSRGAYHCPARRLLISPRVG